MGGSFFKERIQGEKRICGGLRKTGRPWVDHEHLARMEKKTGHNLQKGKPGCRPPDSMK